MYNNLNEEGINHPNTAWRKTPISFKKETPKFLQNWIIQYFKLFRSWFIDNQPASTQSHKPYVRDIFPQKEPQAFERKKKALKNDVSINQLS